MKIVLVLLDGLGDRPYAHLDHRTPLQAAHTPHLDRLARLGGNGLFHAGLAGQCLPSETAHHLIFGYDLENFPGRGLLEAVGEGLAFDDEDVLCLAHLSGVIWKEGAPVLAYGRDDVKGNAAQIGRLFSMLSPWQAHGLGFRLHQTRRNDAVLVISGGASPFVSDSDPIVVGRPIAHVCALGDSPEPKRSRRTADALNAYLTHCHRVLDSHKGNQSPTIANFLVTQRCGRRRPLARFYDTWGMKAMLIASGAVFGGLAHELRMTFTRAKDSKDPGQDLRERIRLALTDKTHDFFHVHTKVPDEAAHKGGPEQKAAVITALDQGLDELVSAVENTTDLIVAVTADHSTPSDSVLIHSGEPVPVVVAGRHVRRDGVSAFDEVSAAGGCLGFLRGKELLLTLLNCADRATLIGHQLGPNKRPYVPEDYEVFKPTE